MLITNLDSLLKTFNLHPDGENFIENKEKKQKLIDYLCQRKILSWKDSKNNKHILTKKLLEKKQDMQLDMIFSLERFSVCGGEDLIEDRSLFWQFSNWIDDEEIKAILFSDSITPPEAMTIIAGISREYCILYPDGFEIRDICFDIKNENYPCKYKREAKLISGAVDTWGICNQKPEIYLEKAINKSVSIFPRTLELWNNMKKDNTSPPPKDQDRTESPVEKSQREKNATMRLIAVLVKLIKQQQYRNGLNSNSSTSKIAECVEKCADEYMQKQGMPNRPDGLSKRSAERKISEALQTLPE